MSEKTWKATGRYHSIEEIVIKKSGCGLRELISPEPVAPHLIEGISDAAMLIGEKAISGKMPVLILGDYDADGVTSTAILTKLLRMFGVEPKCIIPKRFTEGYGISAHHLNGIRDSLIITVDNGITANEAISTAKENGNTVIILDHHLPNDHLPPADVIVDPHKADDKSLYKEYCGAGLAYKLAEYMCFAQSSEAVSRLFTDITVLAMIGTIADCMPLTGDNRRIVKAGLHILNRQESFSKLSSGIRALMNLSDGPYTEDTISFTIAPVLNAPGRLYNSGSTSTLKCLLCTEQADAIKYVATMREINENRKTLVAEWFAEAKAGVERYQSENAILTVYSKKMPEGIVGIVAGKLAEEYRRPCFVFSDASDNKVKASGRTYGTFDLSKLLDTIRPLTERAGGHVGAAGITVTQKNLPLVCKSIQQYGREHVAHTNEDVLYYDMEVPESALPKIMETLQLLAPFGEKVERPVFVIRGFHCAEKFNELYRLMGKQQEHIKLHGTVCEAVGFNLTDEYRKLNSPKTVDLLGCISENSFNGNTTLQFQIVDMKNAFA